MLKKWKWIRFKLSNAELEHAGISTELRVNYNFETAGILTERIAGIPTGLRVKM
jgi:hypothetical protein